jgi:hypothetical protein
MKTLIYQYYYSLPQEKRTHHIMEDTNQYQNYSRKSIQKYAEVHGHDYKFLDQEHPVSPFYGIFMPFTEGWCHDYDAICWMDADILATRDSADVFTMYDPERISAYFMETQNRWKGMANDSPWGWFKDKGHINSGVVIFPRAVYEYVSEYVSDLKHLHNTRSELETSIGNFDQAIVNKIVRDLDSYNEMFKEWNYHLGRYPHDKRFEANLIHYWRKHKQMLIKDFENERILK